MTADRSSSHSEVTPLELDVCAECWGVWRRPKGVHPELPVVAELKVVWRVPAQPGGRRSARTFLTRRAAYQRYARLRVVAKYPCPGHEDDGDPTWGGNFTCPYAHHPGGQAAVDRLFKRFTQWLIWYDKKIRGSQRLTKPGRKRAAVP